MVQVYSDIGDFYLVKTTTGHTHVVQVQAYAGTQTMAELCKAIVQIEKSGSFVTGVYKLNNCSTGKQVFYQNTQIYQNTKRAVYGEYRGG